MGNEVDVLVVSSRIENKRTLLRTLEGLPVNTFAASTIFQALEFLATHPRSIVFCEERLPDGSYRDLLASVPNSPQMNRFIVVQCTDEWEEYLAQPKCCECHCKPRTLISPFSTPCAKDVKIKRWRREPSTRQMCVQAPRAPEVSEVNARRS